MGSLQAQDGAVLGVRLRSSAERGQSLPLLALMLWAIAGVALVIAAIGGRAISAARAQAGADAVALAEASVPGSAAAIAVHNGVTIESLDIAADVDVVVRLGPTRAAARAQRARPQWLGLDPRLQRGLALAEVLLGEAIVVVSGFRSAADQERLWANRHTNQYPVARPGTSLHERGLAVDVLLSQASRLAQISLRTGVCQPLPLLDPVHFSLCQTTPTR